MNVGSPTLSLTPRPLMGENLEGKKQVESGSGQDLTWGSGAKIEWSKDK